MALPAHRSLSTIAPDRPPSIPPRRHLALARGQPASVTRVQEPEDYTGAISGVHVDAIRIGSGERPSRVLDVTDERVTVTTCEIEFPIATHSDIPEHQIVVAFMLEASHASRWCSVPLQPGTAMIYGPGAEHLAMNQPGLRFTFCVAELDHLAELADRTETDLEIPSPGSVQHLPASAPTQALGDALRSFTCAGFGDGLLRPAGDRVLRSLVTLLAADLPQRRIGHGPGIDSRGIVHDCIEFARTAQRVPSLGELCDAAKVSERRLRTAFTDEFDQPPSRYFRAWALGLANRRLRQAVPNELTVTEVAMELGFGHLGRFAGSYRELYGESPSRTLHKPTRCSRPGDEHWSSAGATDEVGVA